MTDRHGAAEALKGGARRIVIEPAHHAAVVFAEGALVDGADDRNDDAPVAARLASPAAAAGAVHLLRSLRAAGVRTAAVAPHGGVADVLASAGLDELVEVQVDPADVEDARPGEPPVAGALMEALARLSATAPRAVLVARRREDVDAARAAGIALAVWVCPTGEAVTSDGGGIAAVSDLHELGVGPAATWYRPACRDDDPWSLHFERLDPGDEARREVLCAAGNGYLVSRGAVPESPAGRGHYPGTYLAGVYNRLVTELDGQALENEELVNVPNWLPFTFRIGTGPWFGADGWDVLSDRRCLDIRYGMLGREVRVRDAAGRVTRVTQRRLASMDEPHLAAVEVTLVAENWSGDMEVRSGLDGAVSNSGVATYRQLAHHHLAVRHARATDAETMVMVVETVQSRVRIALAARTRPGRDTALVGRWAATGPTRIDQHLVLHLGPEQPAAIEKVVAVFTSRDRAISECSLAATATVTRADDFGSLAGAHRSAWERLWARAGVWVDVRGRTPVIVNLHLLHLLQSVSPHTAELDAGVPARGLHGEAYRGHVFWDELFVFPLLNFRFPELTRALLRYRYRRLDEARRLARRAGYRGAMFPWQSATTGREETPAQLYNPRSSRWVPDNSFRQRHVSLAVAYNVWSYYQVTGDVESLVHFGAELMIEIARFWANAATYDSTRDRYDIRGVMGPDEFHDGPVDAPGAGLTNNAYTNVMAAWVLWRARQMVGLLGGHGGGRVFERLDLRPDELALWDRVSTRLTVPFDRDGRIAQFDGYEDLAELDWDAYRARYGDIGRLDLILEAEGDTPNRYKVAKQADVLMLFFMLTAEELAAVLSRLGYRFDPATIPETVRYYLDRTSNGSTLSRVVHAWVLARSDRGASWQVLLDALSADIDDTQGGTTGEGIHLGAMAGTIDLLQRCFVDLDAREDTLHINPRLPDELPRLVFGIDYRGHRLQLDVTHHAVTVRARPSTARPVRVAVRRRVFLLTGGETRTIPIARP